jgi:hypothetical protein
MVESVHKEPSLVTPRVTTDVVRREVAGEVFLVPVRGCLADLEDIFILNEMGGWLWDRMDGSRTLEALVSDVAQEFDTTQGEAQGDLLEFLEGLQAAGLVEDTSGGS